MTVSGIVVTKGDVDLTPCLMTWPADWQVLVWDNGAGELTVKATPFGPDPFVTFPVSDMGVYGRYAAIEHASGDVIYVQDDDVIVSDPQAIVNTWEYDRFKGRDDGFVVCNMPQQFRVHYDDAALVGFGAAFHRDAPARAFGRLGLFWSDPLFRRECDRAFTVLTPRVLVDVEKQDREFASDQTRLWKQPNHHAETRLMLELAREARDE